MLAEVVGVKMGRVGSCDAGGSMPEVLAPRRMDIHRPLMGELSYT